MRTRSAEKECHPRIRGKRNRAWANATDLPPAVSITIIFLDNFYAVASMEGDLIVMLWGKHI